MSMSHGAPARCYTCPLGVAAGVPKGEACPFVPKEREAGVLLYVEGDAAERLWYVVSGYVALSREAGESRGTGVTWAVRRPGEVLGAESLVSGTYRDSAKLLTQTTLCAASREVVDGWLGPETSPARSLVHLLVKARCHEAPRRSGADGGAPRRVAQWLLDDAPGGSAPPIPRSVVAALLGMQPETFSRALAQLAGDGAITVDRKAIRVANFDALVRAAGDDAES